MEKPVVAFGVCLLQQRNGMDTRELRIYIFHDDDEMEMEWDLPYAIQTTVHLRSLTVFPPLWNNSGAVDGALYTPCSCVT